MYKLSRIPGIGFLDDNRRDSFYMLGSFCVMTPSIVRSQHTQKTKLYVSLRVTVLNAYNSDLGSEFSNPKENNANRLRTVIPYLA